MPDDPATPNLIELAAIRGLYEDWIGAYEQYEIVPEEILDLGNGVVLAVNEQKGRPLGSRSRERDAGLAGTR